MSCSPTLFLPCVSEKKIVVYLTENFVNWKQFDFSTAKPAQTKEFVSVNKFVQKRKATDARCTSFNSTRPKAYVKLGSENAAHSVRSDVQTTGIC